MFDVKTIIRENVLTLRPYSCARDEYEEDEGTFLDANENPFGTYNRYPDPYQKELKTRLAQLKGMTTSQIFLGNGSDEVIDLLIRMVCEPGKDSALAFAPSYGMYQVSTAINDVNLILENLTTDFQIDMEALLPKLKDENLKLLFLCSPNNPTGNVMNTSSIERILENFNGIVVIDEAYIDFSSQESWSQRIEQYPNLVVIQTLSKAYGLAGLRIGLAFSSEVIIGYLNSLKPPYNISAVSQQAALGALRDSETFQMRLTLIASEKKRMQQSLNDFDFVLKTFPSEANFVLIKVTDATQIYKKLIAAKLVVRNRNTVIKDCLRITIGSPSENDLLLQELQKIEDEKSIIYR